MMLAIFFWADASAKGSDSYFVRGIVRDSVSDEPLPYSSVMIPGTNRSVVAGSDGIFEINVPSAAKSLLINCIGYDRKELPLKRNSINMYAVYLSPSVTELKELVVKKGRYSKRNNPAVEFRDRLKAASGRYDPMGKPYYSFDKYERISLGLNDFHYDPTKKGEKTSFLVEHIDTSEISGKPYLSLIVKEKRSRVYHRNNPDAIREYVDGTREAGIDEIADKESMRVFMEDVMRTVDLYGNDINLLQNRFVSPLSPIASDFYRFYLTDTVEVAGEKCVVLSFYPRNKASFGFNGHLYVAAGDTTMFVKHVEMSVPRDINLNFVDNLHISQDFAKAPDGTRMILRDNLIMELSYMGLGNFYASRTTSYAGHSFDTVPDSVFATDGPTVVAEESDRRDTAYWEAARLAEIGRGERRVEDLMARFRSFPLYYWGEKVLKVVFGGYVPTVNPSKFDIGPVNSMLSFNTIESVRLRVGGMTMAPLSDRFFGRFYVARGFRDHRWKYGAELEYSFIPKESHSREFPVRSVRLESKYDLWYPGEEYNFTSADNIVLSWKRMRDDRALYRRLNRLSFIWETGSHFSVNLSVANERSVPAPTMALVDGYGNRIKSVESSRAEISLRFAPGEKFFQTRSYRIPVNMDAPVVELRHMFAPRRVLGTDYGVNKTELLLAKRWWMSAFGYLDTYAGGGHVWGSTDYLSLFTPDVNLSYTIQPVSFALMNPMEFLCTNYAMWDFTYWLNGALFNLVPGLKHLKLRETVGFRGYWGNLDSKADPAVRKDLPRFPADCGVTRLDRGPYMELSAGVDNIFKVLRLEYVWRLNYNDVAYPVDHSGLRVAVHVTF